MNYATPALPSNDPLGTDLALDQNGDLIISAQGDLVLHTQINNTLQMIRTRLQTIPATYIFGNDLGSELGALVNEPITPDVQKKALQHVNAALIIDPRIIKVLSVNVQHGVGDQLIVVVSVQIVGQGIIKTTVPIGGVNSV